jgi:hypothetical protein
MTNQFISLKTQELTLEHSLVSISKWESKWHRAFLAKGEKTYEETVDYIKCMTITQNVDDRIYSLLTNENVHNVREYIEAEMTATKFSNDKKGTNREIITSEIIYYWMIELNIPFECQKWHLNKLLTLINVCNIKKTPPKKMSRNEILRRNAALNASRRNSLNTRG